MNRRGNNPFIGTKNITPEEILFRFASSHGIDMSNINMSDDPANIYEYMFGNTTFWDTPIFKGIENKQAQFLQSLTKQINVEQSVYECPKCKSRKIKVRNEQKRSGDESATSTYQCIACSTVWEISN